MFKKSCIVFIVALLVVGIFSQGLFAYSLTGKKITNQIMYVPSSALGVTTISDLNEAVYQWNAQAGSTLMRREPTIRHNSTNYPLRDSKNYIYRNNIGNSNYLAQNTYWSSGSTIVESDINFNMYYSYANGAVSGAYDTWSVFLHEAGHTAGLDHSSNSSAVMYYAVSSNSTNRYLTQDDRNGINAIY